MIKMQLFSFSMIAYIARVEKQVVTTTGTNENQITFFSVIPLGSVLVLVY